jgi:hypothetical protein
MTWLGIEHEKRREPPSASRAPLASRSDRRLADEVRQRLRGLRADVSGVVVEVGAGRVALSGRVARAADQIAIQRAAGSVPGVRGVHDLVVVDPARAGLRQAGPPFRHSAAEPQPKLGQ